MPKYYRKKEQFEIVPLERITLYVDTASAVDMKALLALVWLTSFRLEDATTLDHSNVVIDKVNRTLTFPKHVSKGGQMAYPSFSFDDPFVERLVKYIESIPYGLKLFRKSKRWYQDYLQGLNEKLCTRKEDWLTFHYLRHSRISHLVHVLNAGIGDIKSWTGHKSNAFEEYFRAMETKKFRGRIS